MASFKDAILLRLIERIEHIFTNIDPIQRRHSHKDMACAYQWPEMPQKQRTDKRGNVKTIRVGVRENTDLLVTESFEVITHWIDTQRHGDIVHLL